VGVFVFVLISSFQILFWSRREQPMFEKRNWKVFFLGLSFFLALGVVAFGQATGDVTGTISDPSGAVIPNAKVTMTNTGTGVALTTTSNSAGVYRIINLNPGSYTLKVEAKGFKTSEQQGVEITAGVVNRGDVSLQLGQEVQTVTVEAGAQLVSTEEAKLQNTVRSEQIQNLALNGRNVFDLIKLAPGAVNVQGVMLENGAGTVVNGLRENFNGFLLDGVTNKGLSGGFVTQPNQDIVAEFTVNTLSVSAQYGSSAGSITNMVTKTGSNEFHGDVYEYLRNDALDATDFFTNEGGAKKTELRYNQFGGSLGGPIKRDKTFFFGSFQADRTIAANQPAPISVETPEWRSAVQSALPGSVAALIYNNFPYKGPVTGISSTVDSYVNGTYGSFDPLVCPSGGSNGSISDFYGGTAAQTAPTAAQFQTLFGVTPSEAAACPGLVAGQTATQAANRLLPLQESGIASYATEGVGNLFTGTEWSVRIDHNINENNRLFGRFNYEHQKDQTGPTAVALVRGFKNPFTGDFPSAALSWTRIITPTVVNEAKAGYLRNSTNVSVPKSQAGVPYIYFATGEAPFGAYNGYPQFFHENIYNFSDLLSITHGKHALKTGFDIARNQENSEFNVARPYYYFFDPLYFAADTPASEPGAGVDPGIISGKPAQLATNNRAWRNLNWGAFIQDDWKFSSHLTLNLGLRYDVYSRHHEKFGRMTQFIMGTGPNVTQQIRSANIPAGQPGCDTPAEMAQAQIAGVCGAGGFAVAQALGAPDHNNFSPRFGFAWDPKGNGKTAVRGGFGVSYEGTLYNPLSNSRWNLPFYSFNAAYNYLLGDVSGVVYGPTVGTPGNYVRCTTANPQPAGCSAPSFTGPATNPGQGVGAQANGNLSGWDSSNANLAVLTAVVPNQNFRDPYVYNWFLGIQHQMNRSTGFEINYVGTAGRKLFRAQNVNRNAGGRLPIPGSCASDYGSPAGPNVCSNYAYSGAGRTNPNYGTLRFWNNSTNSIYNALQLSFTRRMSNGLSLNANYTWGHSIDGGSDWHSGSTSANGSAAGDGYSLDIANQSLDRGNSTFDIRHRFMINYVYELPWYKSQTGFAGHVLGGWQTSGLWSFQSGAHWTAYNSSARNLRCFIGGTNSYSANSGSGATDCMNAGGTIENIGGDYNLDGLSNDRPNATTSNSLSGSKDQYANGYNVPAGFFGVPCLGCDGSLGRNTFTGPNQFTSDLSMFKKTNLTERVNLQFRADFFNAFNRANFKMPSSASGGNGANKITSGIFGAAAGVFDPREIQLSLKLNF
jgi:outer membrane receptor protein involved in Fe transport